MNNSDLNLDIQSCIKSFQSKEMRSDAGEKVLHN